MTNDEFKSKFDEFLKPNGFKKKGNYWRSETEELEKVINLQKSNFSNLYYINFGFNLKGLNLDGVSWHVGGRLHQSDAFNLTNSISTQERENALEQIITTELMPILESVNTESDVLTFIKEQPTTNGIFLKVKEYFGIK